MSESSYYRHKPQSDQVKYLSSRPTTSKSVVATPHVKSISASSKEDIVIDSTNISNPKNIVILSGIVLVLLALLFLAVRNFQTHTISKLDTLSTQIKQLSQHQQLIYKTQENQMTLTGTTTSRLEDLKHSLFNATTSPPPQPCKDDGTGACAQFTRRNTVAVGNNGAIGNNADNANNASIIVPQSAQSHEQLLQELQLQQQKASQQALSSSIPRLLPAMSSTSPARARY